MAFNTQQKKGVVQPRDIWIIEKKFHYGQWQYYDSTNKEEIARMRLQTYGMFRDGMYTMYRVVKP